MRTPRFAPVVVLLSFSACARQVAPPPSPAPVGVEERPGTPAARAAGPTEADRAAARALVERGRELLRTGGESKAAEAASLFEQALAADPGAADALWELGWAAQLAGDYDGALGAWDRLRSLRPDYPDLAAQYPLLVMRRDRARALAALPEPGVLPPRDEKPRPGPELTITAVGDVQLGRAWPVDRADLPPGGPTTLFARVHELLASGDVTFGNLETALADDGDSQKCGKRSKACFAFRAPTAYAAALAAAGFDVVSSANNHAGDFGAAGRTATRAALATAGVAYSGVVGDVATLERHGLRIALVAFAYGGDAYRMQDLEAARKVVADARRGHDLVIVSAHAGAEGTGATHLAGGRETFLGEDRGDVQAFAHAVIDAGADLVLGHGPHVLRAMEVYRGRLIAYSLGNFCAWRSFNLVGPLAVSGILRVRLAPNGVLLGAELVPLTLEGEGIPTPDPARRAVEAVRELSLADVGASVLDENGRFELRPPTARATGAPGAAAP